MDITQSTTTIKETCSDIDKCVVIKFRKVKKSSRTCVFGLEHFINEKQLADFCLDIKRKLGTGMAKIVEDEVVGYGFNGNHMEAIREILIKQFSIPKQKIKGHCEE